MGLGQALSIFIIAAFLAFILWGRSRSGRDVLGKMISEPPPTRKSSNRSRKISAVSKTRGRKPASRTKRR